MKIKAGITISRKHGSGDDRIGIAIRDEASGLEFLDAEMTLEDFAAAITGLSHCDLDTEVRGLEFVGKTAVRETRSVEYTGPQGARRGDMAEWIKANFQEPGWIVNPYLSSQSSISHAGGKTILNYSVIKYVEQSTTSGAANNE